VLGRKAALSLTTGGGACRFPETSNHQKYTTDWNRVEQFPATAPDLFAIVANWPEARREHWRTLLRARAIENLCYVAGVNRVGEGGKLRYAGDSVVVSPWGEVLAEGGADEAVLFADVDPAAVRDARAKFPALSDRRPEAYRK
jgi:predicted amidohydrolase